MQYDKPRPAILGRCAICEGPVDESEEPAEMHDPNLSHDDFCFVACPHEKKEGLVHTQCGLSAGWVVS